MEKLIYILTKVPETSDEECKHWALTELVETVRKHGGYNLTVNVADLTEQVVAVAPQRVMGPWEEVNVALAFWLDTLERRSGIETYLDKFCQHYHAYLVTESVPQSADRSWGEGERRPGVTQFGANAKPKNVSDEEFYHNWQILHSTLSFDLHPKRWSYIRNAVARPLTKNAPPYRAIVSEHFKELEDFTDESRYFGARDVVEKMYQEAAGFCDFECIVSGPMSEYNFD